MEKVGKRGKRDWPDCPMIKHNEPQMDMPGDASYHGKGLLFEVGVFLFLILPSMALSFFAVKRGSLGFNLTATATILRDLGLVALIIYFFRCKEEPLQRLGWRWGNYPREMLLGVLLFIPMNFAAEFIDRGLIHAGFSPPATPLPALEATGSVFESLLGLLLVAIVAFSEETMFRGYLILRFRQLTASKILAVIFATVIFAFGHGYEGSAGMAAVGFLGLVLALVYLWRGSLVAPITMHFLQDFLGIVLGPLLTK
jgi:membrane protease YdiL (CAAX protease family)